MTGGWQYTSREDEIANGQMRGPRLATASLLLLGLLIGLSLGLYYAWIVEPVAYVAAAPARLSAENRAAYLLLVGQAYAANGDWEKTQQRLAALDDPAIKQTVNDQFESYLRAGRPTSELQSMAGLAFRLGVNNPAVALFVAEPSLDPDETPASQSSMAEPTLLPTWTRPAETTTTPERSETPTVGPSPTPIPVYRLLRQEQVCDPQLPAQRIEVEVVDALLEPAPGVEVIVRWETGTDNFFTGYHPEKDLGYGDFEMEPGVSYSVLLAAGSPVASGLQVENCAEEQGGLPGGWRLTFQNTDVPQ